LVAHGRRGVDSLPAIPDHDWFKLNELDIPPGAISHTLNPYFSGDLLWTRLSDGPFGGDALVMGASVHDTGGAIGAAIGERATRQWLETYPPGSLAERFARNEIPLFSSTTTGLPVQLYVRQIGLELPGEVDQIAYSYRSSQRPGVRVRQVVAEDGQSGGYWRLDTLYDDQLGVGLPGDQVNDFKYQYAGVVYRDLASGHAEYVGHGSGWIFTPDDDPAGSRVMPPFGGYGSWPDGGPILSLKGEAIFMFILPTGVRPGAVLQPGDTFHFAGHLMPTLDSRVAVTVTAPSGAQHLVNGRANKIGFFYDPDDDFTVHEPGRWTVDVRVWHDGRIGTGQQVFCAMNPLLPCPSGDVLGSQEGRYTFYVVPKAAPGLAVTSPKPGFLAIEAGNESDIPPITITGPISPGLTNVTVDYTITMPGFILEQGQATVDGDGYTFTYDPVALHELFPNLDLTGRDDWGPGLSDTIAIGLYLQGYDGVKTVHQATTITLQGEQVYVGGGPPGIHTIFLPVVQGGNAS